jgi:hypothetical protein
MTSHWMPNEARPRPHKQPYDAKQTEYVHGMNTPATKVSAIQPTCAFMKRMRAASVASHIWISALKRLYSRGACDDGVLVRQFLHNLLSNPVRK